MSSVQTDEALRQAMVALQGQRPAEAERIAAALLKSDPRHQRALHVLGCALLMQKRPQDALAPLEQAARGRHDPELDTQLAITLRQLGRSGEALLKLKRATKRTPPYPAAFHELGYLLHSIGRHEEAIEALHRGLEAAPMMPELSIQLGNVLLQRGRRIEARIAFARALAVAPHAHDALLGLAQANSELGEYGPAADCYRQCLVNRPDDAGLWLNLGHCLLALGQRDAGHDCFRTAARGEPARAGRALSSLVKSGRGRFWLRPSAAARFFANP